MGVWQPTPGWSTNQRRPEASPLGRLNSSSNKSLKVITVELIVVQEQLSNVFFHRHVPALSCFQLFRPVSL